MVCDRLAFYFAAEALATISVGRSAEDGYVMRFRSEGEAGPPLTEGEAISLLPVGSNWLPAVGWHSYSGIPFSLDGEMWLAVGIETVKPHSPRGSYVTYCGFVYRLCDPPVRQLTELANELSPAIRSRLDEDESASDGMATHGAALDRLTSNLSWLRRPRTKRALIEASSRTPSEHVEVEAYILRTAAKCYSVGESLLFRTLILSQSQLGPPRCSSELLEHGAFGRLRIQQARFLGATVPTIKRSFSS